MHIKKVYKNVVFHFPCALVSSGLKPHFFESQVILYVSLNEKMGVHKQGENGAFQIQLESYLFEKVTALCFRG